MTTQLQFIIIIIIIIITIIIIIILWDYSESECRWRTVAMGGVTWSDSRMRSEFKYIVKPDIADCSACCCASLYNVDLSWIAQ